MNLPVNPGSLAAWCAALFLGSTLFSHTVAFRLIVGALAGVLCIIALVRDRDGVSLLPPIWLPFLLWAAWSAASLAWSVEPERSEKELRNEVIYTGIALWTCYVAAQMRHAGRIILPVTAAAVTLLCALALYHYVQGFESYATGRHGGPGNLSTALITLLPCGVLATWYGARAGWPRALVWGVAFMGLLLTAAYTTLSRTVWIAFGVELLLIGGFLASRHQLLAASRGRQIAAALAIGLVAATAFATLHIQEQRLANGGLEISHDQRLMLWPEVVQYIEERPLTGYGFGRGLLRKSLNEDFNNGLLWHAHNIFLDMALQIGWPGVALFVLLLVATLREGWWLARAPIALSSACGIALLAVLAGMLVRNSTDVLLVRQNALLFWGVVGVLLAWGRQARELPRARAGP
jgi:O-antigen ligase